MLKAVMNSMIERYKHTQVGYLIIIVMAIVMVGIGIILATVGLNGVAIAVLIIMGVVLVLFSSLTVIIRENELEVRFGPGLIHKRFKLSEIESCQVVKNHWYYGWGLRLTPQGMLYSVSGLHAVELKLTIGKKFRIGTDVPEKLDEAIRSAVKA